MKHFLLLLSLPVAIVAASPPNWWTQQDTSIIVDSATPDHHAVVTVGQLKHVATMAKLHLDKRLQLSDSDWDAVYSAGSNPFPFSTGGDNTIAANNGQLKFLAKGMYDLLIANGYDTKQMLNENMPTGSTWNYDYPWTPSTSDDDNYALVNQGQLKWVFSFGIDTLHPLGDEDYDGMLNGWEESYNLDPYDNADAAQNLDDDELTNLQEHNAGTNPLLGDTDGDGYTDHWELQKNFDPTNATDATEDNDNDSMYDIWETFYFDTLSRDGSASYDSDGLNDLFEHNRNSDPTKRDTDDDGLPDDYEFALIDADSGDNLVTMDDVTATTDADGDFLYDSYEYTIIDDNSSDSISDVSDVHPWQDYNGNGKTNEEDFLEANPLLAIDTDGDGLTDWVETEYGTDPNAVVSPTQGLGYIDQDIFTGFNLHISQLQYFSKYPDSPDISNTLTALDGPSAGDYYIRRIYGYVTAPVTGEYRFSIASDDSSRLWLSTDENPSNVSLVARVNGWTFPYEYDKNINLQRSAPIMLQAGQRYFIEVIQEDDSSGDHVSVGWQFPGQGLVRVPRFFLSPAE